MKKSFKNLIACALSCCLCFGAAAFISMSVTKTNAADVNFSMPAKVGNDEIRNGKFIVYNGKINATGDSYEAGFPFSNMTDKRTDTYWHVKYGNQSSTIKVDFGKELYVYGFSYWSRHDSASQIFSGNNGGDFYATINGKNEKVGHAEEAHFDKWNSKDFAFDRMVSTNHIEIKGHVDYCAEIKPAYINIDHYDEFMKIANDRYSKMTVGTEIGQFDNATKNEFKEIIDREFTDNDSKAQKIYDLINEIYSLNSKKQVSTKPLNDKIAEVEQSIFTGKNVGNRIGNISAENYKDLLLRFNNIKKDVEGINGLLGSIIQNYLDELEVIKNEYNKNLIVPSVKCFFDNDYQKEGNEIKNISQLVDKNDVTEWKFTYEKNETEFSRIVNPNDEKLYFDYDLFYPEMIDSLTVASFWSANQSPTIVKVQKKVDGKYENVETLNFNITDNTGNTVSQTLKFKTPFAAKDLRVHIDGAKKGHGAVTIKEMNFGLVKAEFTNRTLTLSDDLSVNYYANVTTGTPFVKFVKNGKETTVEGVKTEIANEYKFTYEGINPQCMGDKFTAQLLLNNEPVGEIDTYSVLDYCTNMLKKESNSTKLTKLLKDILNYGAMAQEYTGYNVENLVNKDITGATQFVNVDNTDKQVGKVTNSEVYFTSAGLKLNNTVSIFFEFTAKNLDNVKVTIGDKPVKPIECGNGKYRVYTNNIKATEMDDIFTAKLSVGGKEVHFVNYSVKSYVYSHQNDTSSENENLVNLVKSMYVYGNSAKTYANSQSNKI